MWHGLHFKSFIPNLPHTGESAPTLYLKVDDIGVRYLRFSGILLINAFLVIHFGFVGLLGN